MFSRDPRTSDNQIGIRPHHKESEKPKPTFFDTLKNLRFIKLWDKIHSPFLDERGFEELLIKQQELHPGNATGQTDVSTGRLISPQAMQGRWQAYGQIRAARITGRCAVLATGVVGTGLWLYQQKISGQARQLIKQSEQLSSQAEQLKENQKELKKGEVQYQKAKKELDDREKGMQRTMVGMVDVANSYRKKIDELKDLTYQYKARLEFSDKFVKNLCDTDSDCHDNYQRGIINPGHKTGVTK